MVSMLGHFKMFAVIVEDLKAFDIGGGGGEYGSGAWSFLCAAFALYQFTVTDSSLLPDDVKEGDIV
ncbi:hypothetical protein M8C21_014309, partial [Ambrosia artemisiifolia]